MNGFDVSPLWISVKTAVVSTTLTFCAGITTAWLVTSYRGRGKSVIDGILSLPLVLPPTVVGFFILILFGKHGPAGKLLALFDTGVVFTWSATVIAAAVVSFPLMYRTSRGAFEQIDANMLGAARTLGASEMRLFLRVVVPLAWPGIAAGTVLSFARSLGEFGATLMVAGNIPGKTQTIPVAIFFAAEGGDMKTALIWVILIVSLSFAVIVAMNHWNGFQRRRIGGKGYGV